MKHFCLLFIVLPSVAGAQIGFGPRIAALGGASSGVSSIWNLAEGQAGFDSERPVIALGYEQLYLNPELNVQTALFAYPFGHNTFGLSFQRYGFSAYAEQKAGLALERRFGNSLSVALSANYHSVRISGYGSAQAFTAGIGVRYMLNDRLCLASQVSNPANTQFAEDTGVSLPVRISFGASVQASDKILLILQAEKSSGHTADGRTGLEYQLVSWLALRGGLSVNPFRQYAGFGVKYKQLVFDAAASSHPVLGYSPQVGLSYAF